MNQPSSGSRLVLEPLRVDHAVELASVLDDPALHTFIGGQPLTEPELRAQYARQVLGRSVDGTELWFNWIVRSRRTDQAVGYVQATVSAEAGRLVAELAWVIGTAHQGHGYAAEAAGLMAFWLREHHTAQLLAHVHPEHLASQRVADRLGLHPTEILLDGETRWQNW